MAVPFSLLIQKVDDEVVDTRLRWGVVCKDFPFRLFGTAKDLGAENLPGRDGDMEYIPNVIPIEAYELEVPFVYKGERGTANENIINFLNYLTGRDGVRPDLTVYDTFSMIGRRNVRFVSVAPDAFVRRTA